MTARQTTVAAAAEMLASGETSSVRLLHGALDALSRDADRYHAMLSLNPLAEAEAARADRDRADGKITSPLHGIPIVVKDNIDVAGMPTTSGCRALAGALPRRSATIVDRLRASGAVILGKTNLSEFSFEIRSRSSLGGDVLNPRLPCATAGGSSGGTAVAVLRGYALAGIGTDTGGSIRIPAAFNGLVGFRPAFGVFPMQGIAPLAPSTDTVGPIARTVEDLALVLAAMGQQVHAASPNGLRIGLIRQLFGTDPQIGRASDEALRRLAASGIVAIDVPPLPAELDPSAGDHIVDAEFAAAFDTYLASNFIDGLAPASLAEVLASCEFLPDHAASLAARLAIKGRETASILARHRALANHLRELREQLDLAGFAYPTSQVVPDSLENPRGGWAPELAARTGWAAISVCAGYTESGMPVGIEFLAPTGSEPILLALGAAAETAPA